VNVKAFWLQSVSLSFYRFDSKSREGLRRLELSLAGS
jgi:hypothetical protein